jgi:hypothetical protein
MPLNAASVLWLHADEAEGSALSLYTQMLVAPSMTRLAIERFAQIGDAIMESGT